MSQIPEDILKSQEQNSQAAIRDLKEAYGLIEKLVLKTYMNNEMDANPSLRNIRSDVSRLISEMGTRGLSSFNGKEGNLEDFHGAEKRFVDASASFLELANNSILSQDPVDVFSLESRLDMFEKSLNGRIIIDKKLLDEFNVKQAESEATDDVSFGEGLGTQGTDKAGTFMGVDSEKALPSEKKTHPFGVSPARDMAQSLQGPGAAGGGGEPAKETDAQTLSRIYNYFNLLEHKYSSNHPEVSNDGSYIGDKRWILNVSDKHITGVVKGNVVRTALQFETYWHPMDDVKETMQYVQSMAGSVPKDQFWSICLVSSVWDDDTKEWAKGFMHPRLLIFLYELDTDTMVFNEDAEASGNLYVWHSADRDIESLEDKLQSFIEDNEYFDAKGIAGESGLNVKGAEKFLKELECRKKIINVGFGSSSYTKSKLV